MILTPISKMASAQAFLQRVVGAAALDSAIYEEIEADGRATIQAAAMVLLSSAAAGFATAPVRLWASPHSIAELDPMSREREAIDQRPRLLPDIRTDAGSITFALTPARVPHHARLMIRCAPDGELWVSIAPASTNYHEPPAR